MNTIEIKDLVDDLPEDLPDTTAVEFEVWAIGYDENDDCTDCDVYLNSFETPDEAIKYAESLTLETVLQSCEDEDITEVSYFSIEVETTIEDPEDEGTINVGTIWEGELRI